MLKNPKNQTTLITENTPEIIYSLIHSSPLIYWRYWLCSGILIFSFAFFLYPLFLQGWWGIVMDIFLAVLGLVVFLKGCIIWYFSYWKITNHRVIDVFQKGFFSQEKTEVFYFDIDNVYGQRNGFFQGFFRLGDVFIKIKNSKIKIKLSSCRNYSQLISLINERREEYLNARASLREKKAQLLLLKIKEKLGEEKFNELIF